MIIWSINLKVVFLSIVEGFQIIKNNYKTWLKDYFFLKLSSN